MPPTAALAPAVGVFMVGVDLDEGEFGDDYDDEELDAYGVLRGGRPLDPAVDLDRRAFREILDDQVGPREPLGPLHFSDEAFADALRRLGGHDEDGNGMGGQPPAAPTAGGTAAAARSAAAAVSAPAATAPCDRASFLGQAELVALVSCSTRHLRLAFEFEAPPFE